MRVVSGLGLELSLFGNSILLGICLFAVYDVIRIIRRVFAHGIIWISVEDVFFWTASAVCFFLRLCRANNGIIRGYILLGVLFGAWLYYRLCSRHLMKILTRLIMRIKKRLKKVRKAVTIRLEKFRKPDKTEKMETGYESGKEETS